MRVNYLKQAGLILLLALGASVAKADLTQNLGDRVSELTQMNDELASISVSGGNSCTQLGTLNTSIQDYIASLEQMTTTLSAPLTLEADDFTSLDDLSYLTRSMGSEALRLSWELRDIEGIYTVFEYRAALSAMLQLSSDIGKMADRILEMADRILVMADNIGAMSDRILVTQQLQNSNVALMQTALLTTQQNMVAMSDSLSSITYNLTLGQLSSDTQALIDDMNSRVLNETNMATELAAIQSQVTGLLTQTVNAYVWATQNSQIASHYIDGDTLTLMGDLSTMHTSLATALTVYANSIDELSPLTDTVILGDATDAMLQLTRDIGVMSDRIMEMSDKIIVMADNIGLMADDIVTTQNLQQTNADLTTQSIITAQNTTIGVIQNMGL